MTTPPVCVLMPVYNVGPYLGAAIESVLAQTFTDYEFVIVDDGSKDQTLGVAEKYAARDRRIRVISRPNTGIVGALEDGLVASSAPWIARLDGDDTAAPQRLARQMEYLSQHPQCVSVGSFVMYTDPWGHDVCPLPLPVEHEQIDAALLKGESQAMTHGAATISRAAIQAVGGYRAEFNTIEDLDLFLRLAEYGRLANIPEYLLCYRQHPVSTNHTRYERQRGAINKAITLAYERRGLPRPPNSEVWLYRPESVAEFYRHISRLAATAGNYATSRRNALAALWREPLSPQSWKAGIRAGLGPLLPVIRRTLGV